MQMICTALSHHQSACITLWVMGHEGINAVHSIACIVVKQCLALSQTAQS
jgi:hypothetical protein